MSAIPIQSEPLSSFPPPWASLTAFIMRRMPLGRYRMMHWLHRRSSARFVARFPGSALDLLFECDLRNALAREVFFTGCYEPPETMLIRQLIDPGGTFIDVGAHWGYFSLMMAEHVGPKGRVVAVEADPRIYSILERNFALNNLPNVKLVCAAAAAETGWLSLIGFDESGDNWGTSRIGAVHGAADFSFDVPARGLDDLLDEFGVDKVDLIKIDIEGGEALALSGMSAGLRLGRYRRLLLELHPCQLAEHDTNAGAIIENLLEMGYRGWVIAHAAPAVRRAAYAHRQPVDSLLRPLRWPEPLDAWPHLVFALNDDLPVHRVPRGRRASPVIDERATLKMPHIASSTTRRPASVHEDFEPILIVGHPRSGTTLLATILNRHSQVAIPPELSFFLPAHRQRRRGAVRSGSHKALLEYARSIPHCSEIANESVEAMFKKGPPTCGNLFRCMLIDYANAQGKPRCGEKSPWHLLAVPELMRLDPRQVPVDDPRWPRCGTVLPWHAVLRLGAGLVALPDLVPSRGAGGVLRAALSQPFPHLPVRGLVEEPVAEIKRIDEFLGLAFERTQLVMSERDALLSSGEWWKHRAGRHPDADRAHAWRRSSDAAELQYLTALMNPDLVRFGYDSYLSPNVAGPRGRYYGYRALASLLRASLVPSRLTGAFVRTVQGPRPRTVEADSFVPCRSGEKGPEAPVTS